MKKLYSFLFLLILFSHSNACSCSGGKSFCETHSGYDVTISGIIVANFPHGISIKILNLLHGVENRDTINVWDLGGPYSMCNDSMFDASAAYLGNIGDTLVIALPKIDSAKTAWDVVGDYKTPGFQCDAYRLWVTNSVVHGFISGSPYCYYLHNCLNNYSFEDFITEFPIKSLSCETWLSISESNLDDSFSLFPNPFSTQLNFKTSNNEPTTVSLFNFLGQHILLQSFTNSTILNTAQMPNGIYFYELCSGKQVIASGKVVKQ